MTKCPVCEEASDSYGALATHFSRHSDQNDPGHIMWLNRNITKEKQSAEELSDLLQKFLSLEGTGLKKWVKKRFVERFYGERPHPFILALQHPSKELLLGYVLEHRHFLKQWTKSLSWVVVKTDDDEVIRLELDNIVTEYVGYNKEAPSHYDLLIKMGESLGMDREKILSTEPLPDTASAIQTWAEIAEKRHWLETMTAMHSLELVANKNIKEDGAKMTYFNPAILKGSEITGATKEFLGEGYEADVDHSEIPLQLAEKYAKELGIADDVQITFLRSMEAFDRYLTARLERAIQLDEELASYIVRK